jgi:Cu(I)/Ag(I) efflux system membrane fusion protein
MTPKENTRSSVASQANVVTAAQSGRWWLRQLISASLMIGVGLSLIAALGLAQRLGWISADGSIAATSTDAAAQIYTCPMHPQIRQPGAGRCPICGMELVSATSTVGSELDELAVRIEPAARRLANISTSRVSYEPVETTLQTIGAIAIDESRMATIPSYVDGRIEELYADYTGVIVAEGDHLAVVYSPDLYSAQVEYLESRKAVKKASTLEAVRAAQQKLVDSSRQRLVELGLTLKQIGDLEQTGRARSRLTIYAPVGGTVMEKTAMEGRYVKAGEPIYRIADLSTVWLMLELYPEDAARVRFGQRVEAELQSLPGEVFRGRVAFIAPTVNASDRTVGVRVEFLNDEGRLRPGDYASAKVYLPIGQQGEVYDADLAGRWISPMHPQIIRTSPGECPICGMDLVPTSRYGYSDVPVEQPSSTFVPRSAVLMAGANSVVYVETEPGRFEIRPVTLGPVLKDRVIIHSGLTEGETVATAGNFLIHSQMQLAGKPSLIDPSRAVAAGAIRKKPLEFNDIEVTPVAGAAGSQLEQLYTAYFNVQRALAADRMPEEAEAVTLYEAAVELSTQNDLSADVRELVEKVIEYSEHLHHLDIQKARLKAFRPISHAIVALAAIARGDQARQQFSHMFCPMLEGGSGDWLQPNTDLCNPYWGSWMLTCGDFVRQFPLGRQIQNESGDQPQGSMEEQ